MMDKTLIEQINAWTEAEEHDKVVGLLNNIPLKERDFESTGLLARAYNCMGEYEKGFNLLDSTRKEGAGDTNWNYRIGYALYFLGRYAESLAHFSKANELTPDDGDTLSFIRYCNARLPFRKRVDDFWQWFTANEVELARMVEARGKNTVDTDRIVGFVSAGTDLLSEDVHFNLGGDHEFTFSVEGNADLFYLYPYLISRMPEQFRDKWRFFPFNQGMDNSFSFCMYGVQVDMAEVRLAVTYQEDSNDFNISFYEENLCSLTEPQSYNAYYIMMEIMLGEGLSYQYIADVKRADAAVDGMITLPELRKHITGTLKAHGKEVYDNPQQVYSSYHFEPEDNEELRYDVVVGSTCFMPLISEYYQESTDLFDHLNQFGAQAAFLAFPFDAENEQERKALLDFRYQLEDRMESELLKPEGLGLLLGGSIGQGTCYIDLLLFDELAFIEKIIPFLEEYSQYRFYLSDFRQHCGLTRLFHATQEEEES